MATKKLGRSLLAGETTVAELRTLTKRFSAAKHYLTDELTTYDADSVVVDGDLRVEELDTSRTFHKELCCLVVTGNLVVDGLYQDRDYPQTAVYVLGDLTATDAITAGALGVAGDVTVEETLVGFYNDHAADLQGKVTARTFVPENHHFSIGGTLRCEHLLGRNALYRIKVKGKKPTTVDELAMKELLVPEVLDILGEGDQLEINLEDSVLRKRVRDGLPILKQPTSKPAKPTAKTTPAKARTAATSKTAAKKPPVKPVKKTSAKPKTAAKKPPVKPVKKTSAKPKTAAKKPPARSKSATKKS